MRQEALQWAEDYYMYSVGSGQPWEEIESVLFSALSPTQSSLLFKNSPLFLPLVSISKGP